MASREARKIVTMRTSITTIRPGEEGFTLIELLLVVALITILAGAAGGVYVGTYRKTLVEKDARSFALAAKYARMIAVEKQREVELVVNEKNGSFLVKVWMFDEASGQEQEVVVTNQYCRPVKLADGVKFEALLTMGMNDQGNSWYDEDEQTIVFYPDGSSDTAVIQIGDKKNHYTITIMPACGIAKLKEGTVKDVTIPLVDLDDQND